MRENGIIIYKSKYGSAKRYADWLHEMTGFECIEAGKTQPDKLTEYKTVIFCGGIYASGIAGISFLKKNTHKLSGKRLIVFCVGASPYDERSFAALKEHNLSKGLKNAFIFYGRGAWDESKMSFTDRTLCRLLQKSVAGKAPEEREPWMEALICAKGRKCDWTDKKYLVPLLEFLKEG